MQYRNPGLQDQVRDKSALLRIQGVINPKHEIRLGSRRQPQIRNNAQGPKFKCSKPWEVVNVILFLSLANLIFEFVSYFDIRICG